MSKEFKCTQCGKKEITEREDTRHTDYSYGLCEDCKPKPEPVFILEPSVIPDQDQEQRNLSVIRKETANSLACRECEFIAKTEFGLKSHMRVHK